MQYPTHEFTRPGAVEKLRRVDTYPPSISGDRLVRRLESFGSVIVTSVVGNFELLIAAPVLEKLQAPLIRHLAHERRVYDQANGFVSQVSAFHEDGPVRLRFRRDGYAIVVWLDGDPEPPILYLDAPVPVDPPPRLVEDITRDIVTPVPTHRPPPETQAAPMLPWLGRWRDAAVAALVLAAGMVLLEVGRSLHLASVMFLGAVVCLVAGAALVAAVRSVLAGQP